MRQITLLIAFAIWGIASNIQAQTIYLQEDFEVAAMPTGWTENLVGSSALAWEFTTDGSHWLSDIPSHTTYANNPTVDWNNEAWLITPSFDLSSATNPILQYKCFNRNEGGNFTIGISIDGGTFNNIFTLDDVPYWHNVQCDLSAYAGESDVRITFYYDTSVGWSYGYALDDVVIYEKEQHDLKIADATPFAKIAANGTNINPTVKIANKGTSSEPTYSVDLEVLGTSYHHTINVTNPIAAGDATTLVFPQWTATTGNHIFKATVYNVTNDAYEYNDTLSWTHEVSNFDYIEGGIYSSVEAQWDESFGTINPTTADYTEIRTYDNVDNIVSSFTCGAQIKGIIYAVHSGLTVSKYLYAIYPDGAPKIVADFTNQVPGRIKGIAYDAVNDKIYLATWDPSYGNNYSFLYEVGHDWECTQIGGSQITYDADCTHSAIACDNVGQLYAYVRDYESDITDRLYLLNKNTGATTFVGNTGINNSINEMDISFNKETNQLYATNQVDGSQDNLLTEINTTTGQHTVINEITESSYPYTLCVVYSGLSTGINNIVAEEIQGFVYPNPSNGQFTIEGENIKNIEIIDITGKVIYTVISSEAKQSIDLSNNPKGIYFAKITNLEGIKIQKLIIQ